MSSFARTARAEWDMHWVEGADHSFHVLKSSGRTDAQVMEEIGDVTKEWLGLDGTKKRGVPFGAPPVFTAQSELRR